MTQSGLPDQDNRSVKVSVMQREFTIVCANESEVEGLIEAAAYLDKQIRSIAAKGRILGQDRCAVMAGLNISYELLQLQKSVGTRYTNNSRLDSLRERIDKAVSKFGETSP